MTTPHKFQLVHLLTRNADGRMLPVAIYDKFSEAHAARNRLVKGGESIEIHTCVPFYSTEETEKEFKK